jgi:hypothetical protein
MACWLLTWAAADLLVPELCNGEEFKHSEQGQPGAPDSDDCFCCCSHTESPVLEPVVFAECAPPAAAVFLADNLAAGMPRSLYRPPLLS